MARLAERLGFEVGEQLILRRLPLHVRARIDQAIAHPVLQRNAPLPAGFARGGAGERVGRPGKALGTATARSHGSQWLQSS